MDKLLFGGLNVPGIDVHQSCPPCVKGGRGDWAAGTDDLQPTSANSQGTIVTVCTDSPNLFSHVSDYCTIPQSASLTAPFTQGSHGRCRASTTNNNLPICRRHYFCFSFSAAWRATWPSAWWAQWRKASRMLMPDLSGALRNRAEKARLTAAPTPVSMMRAMV